MFLAPQIIFASPGALYKLNQSIQYTLRAWLLLLNSTANTKSKLSQIEIKKAIPIAIATENKTKYPGINLMKGVNDLSNENCKTLAKEIE